MSAIVMRFVRPLLLLVALSFVIPLSASALDVPKVPSDLPILDQTKTLTDEQRAELGGIIAAERQNSGNQIGVLMISTLEGEALEDYSIRVAREWGIGTKERNNGVLLLVVKDDRKIRIDVGYGLEGALPDIRAGQIIRDRMSPLLGQGKYYEGIKSGVEGITTAIHNEVDPALNTRTEDKGPSIPWEFLFAAVFILPSWLASILARTKSWWAGGVLGGIAGLIIAIFAGFLFIGLVSIVGLALIGLLFDRAVSSNYQRRAAEGLAPSWWAGGTHLGGGGDSGGFGGFGGGSFGGGGASGDF